MVNVKYILVFVIVFALLLSLLYLHTHYSFDRECVDKYLLREFLESQYVSEISLLRAATFASPDSSRIYVASDNLLASRALATLNSPLSFKVLTTLNNKYGGGFDELHEVLLGVKIPDKFYCRYNEYLGNISTFKFGTLEIYYEKSNHNCIIEDWDRYADLVIYRALNSLLQGSRPYAEKLFERLMSMWDGYGFKDAAFNGKYATYKLALAIFLYRALEAAGSSKIMKYSNIINKCYEIIDSMQRIDGGIVTDYEVSRGKVIPSGDANTETTSIVVLALYSNYPGKIGGNARNKYTYPASIAPLIQITPYMAFLA